MLNGEGEGTEQRYMLHIHSTFIHNDQSRLHKDNFLCLFGRRDTAKSSSVSGGREIEEGSKGSIMTNLLGNIEIILYSEYIYGKGSGSLGKLRLFHFFPIFRISGVSNYSDLLALPQTWSRTLHEAVINPPQRAQRSEHIFLCTYTYVCMS